MDLIPALFFYPFVFVSRFQILAELCASLCQGQLEVVLDVDPAKYTCSHLGTFLHSA